MRGSQFALLMSALFTNTTFIVGDSSAWYPLVIGLLWLAVAFACAWRNTR